MSHHEGSIKNPGSLAVPGGMKILFCVFAAIGIGTFLMTVKTDAERVWSAFVINHFFFMCLGLGGLFFASIQWLTGAMWSAPLRRVGEALTSYLPFVGVSFIILVLGMKQIYLWTDMHHVQGDLVLEGKTAYLNSSFFIIRNLVGIGIWLVFRHLMIGNSITQDSKPGDNRLTLRNRFLAPPFLMLFAITFTMASFDQIMSLDPHWFSTIFGVYCFAGMYYSTHATIALITIRLKRRGYLDGIVNENHLHDLGKFMFAFTVFWAYIGFSQFMLIWYANLPEETGYYLLRMNSGWMPVTFALFVCKFLVPFFVLIKRDAKRNETVLTLVAVWMLIFQWVDIFWMVQPEFFKEGPRFGLIEIGLTLGFIGVFGFLVTRFLSKNTVVAIGDPRLAESVHHHHQ